MDLSSCPYDFFLFDLLLEITLALKCYQLLENKLLSSQIILQEISAVLISFLFASNIVTILFLFFASTVSVILFIFR